MNTRPISAVITDLDPALAGERISVGELLEAFHERGFGFLLLVLSMPAAIPIPGLNTIFAVPMLLLTLQQAAGRHTIWMPDAMQRKTIPSSGLKKILGGAMPWLKRLEIIVRPRLEFMTHGAMSQLVGVVGTILAAVACLPVPLTHTVPSIGIALMSVGVLMRDGLAVIAGAAIGLAWVAILAFAIIFLGAEGIDFVKGAIKSVL